MTDPSSKENAVTTTRYRKKPIPVEAHQLLGSEDGQTGRDLAAWCGGTVSGAFAEPKVFVPTLEGDLVARAGDWIVKGHRGEFWPVKGDIFAETYEPAAADTDESETTTRVFAALHRDAEETVTRAAVLYEQWVKAGPPPLGASMARWWDKRLAELRTALNPQETP